MCGEAANLLIKRPDVRGAVERSETEGSRVSITAAPSFEGLGGTLWPRPYRPCGATSPNAWEVKGNEVAPEAQSNCAAKPQTFFHVEPLRPCGASSPLKRGAWESAGGQLPERLGG